jgi:hypothetical protein
VCACERERTSAWGVCGRATVQRCMCACSRVRRSCAPEAAALAWEEGSLAKLLFAHLHNHRFRRDVLKHKRHSRTDAAGGYVGRDLNAGCCSGEAAGTSGCRRAAFVTFRLHSTARPCILRAKKGTVDGQPTAGQKRERACGADGGLTLAAASLKAAVVVRRCRVGCACVLNTWIRVRKFGSSGSGGCPHSAQRQTRASARDAGQNECRAVWWGGARMI